MTERNSSTQVKTTMNLKIRHTKRTWLHQYCPVPSHMPSPAGANPVQSSRSWEVPLHLSGNTCRSKSPALYSLKSRKKKLNLLCLLSANNLERAQALEEGQSQESMWLCFTASFCQARDSVSSREQAPSYSVCTTQQKPMPPPSSTEEQCRTGNTDACSKSFLLAYWHPAGRSRLWIQTAGTITC